MPLLVVWTLSCLRYLILTKPTDRFGIRMKEQVSKRLDQLNSGLKVDKNDLALEEVVQELKDEGLYVNKLKKRKSKKKESVAMDEEALPVEEPTKKKKKKAALAQE